MVLQQCLLRSLLIYEGSSWHLHVYSTRQQSFSRVRIYDALTEQGHIDK